MYRINLPTKKPSAAPYRITTPRKFMEVPWGYFPICSRETSRNKGATWENLGKPRRKAKHSQSMVKSTKFQTISKRTSKKDNPKDNKNHVQFFPNFSYTQRIVKEPLRNQNFPYVQNPSPNPKTKHHHVQNHNPQKIHGGAMRLFPNFWRKHGQTKGPHEKTWASPEERRNIAKPWWNQPSFKLFQNEY